MDREEVQEGAAGEMASEQPSQSVADSGQDAERASAPPRYDRPRRGLMHPDEHEGVREAEAAFAEMTDWPVEGPHRRHFYTKVYDFESHEAGLFLTDLRYHVC